MFKGRETCFTMTLVTMAINSAIDLSVSRLRFQRMTEVSELDLSRICVSLQAEEKGRRRRALEEIANVFRDNSDSNELLRAWQILNRYISKILNDPTEVCRDLAVEILKKFLSALPPDDKHIVYVIPILSRRLGSQELIESSEEMRLNCVDLIKSLIPRYKDYLPAYVDDLTGILTKTVTDSYPEVKRRSCECVSEFARFLPRHFYSHSENLVKPILSNFTHQHHKVRTTAVKTIGDLLRYGNSKSMEEVATPLAERLFDQSGIVRGAVVEVAGKWLTELPDRYSWWYKILPLVMTGLHDEIEEIRVKAATMWDAAGKQYLQENENDEKLKNKMDFLTEDPVHYPPGVSRPNLGCRVIAQQNLYKLVNGITRELDDWMPDIRVRSAQLLCVLTLNVEEEITQHIEKLLPAMYRACNDEDRRVVENVELAARYLGYFVEPEVYCPLVLPTLEESVSAGHLRVFAAILGGSERKALSAKLQTIGDFLQQSYICQNKKSVYQQQILSCCNSLFSVCQEDCVSISQELFTVIFTTLSMATEESIRNESQRLLNILVDIEDSKDTEELYCNHLRPLIKSISIDCGSWSVYSAESQIFSASLIHAGTAVAQNMDIILSVLKETTNPNADAELRLKHFILLCEYFSNNQEPLKEIKDLDKFVDVILQDVLLPGLIWRAGRAAEAIRTATVCCLCSFLQNPVIFSDEETQRNIVADRFTVVFEKIIPILVSLADDNAKKTRLYSLRAICSMMTVGQRVSCVTEKHIHDTYPAVMKRLDDGCDEIRYAALEALVEVWRRVPKDYDLVFNKCHVDSLYTTAIIHLDDPEAKFQTAMLESLKHLARIHPELLYQKLQNCRMNFRNQSGITELIDHCQAILRNN